METEAEVVYERTGNDTDRDCNYAGIHRVIRNCDVGIKKNEEQYVIHTPDKGMHKA